MSYSHHSFQGVHRVTVRHPVDLNSSGKYPDGLQSVQLHVEFVNGSNAELSFMFDAHAVKIRPLDGDNADFVIEVNE